MNNLHKQSHVASTKSSDSLREITSRWYRVLHVALLFSILVIIGVRPLIQETHDTALQPFAAALTEVPQTSPVPTLWINLAIILIFGITVALRTAGFFPRVPRTGLVVGYCVVVLSAVASCFVAGNGRLAINGTLDWLTLPLLTFSLVLLLQKDWHIRLAICVIVASGAAMAVECYDQVFVSLPATADHYEQTKESFWAQQNVQPGSPEIELFERRLHERAANGFQSMANVTANFLVLMLFTTIGAVFAGRRVHWRIIPVALLLCFLAGALILTHSRGGMGALFLGAGIGLLFYLFRRWIEVHRRQVYCLGWIAVITGMAGMVGLGLKTGGWLEDSLTFRWWYLETTFKIVKDHPLRGIGTDQYAFYYPRYKDSKSPEEIQNPHNFLAQSAAEWGLPGLIGMVLMLFGASWRLAQKSDDASFHASQLLPHDAPRSPPNFSLRRYSFSLWCILLTIVIWLVRIMMVGKDDFSYILATNAYPLFGWALAFVVCRFALHDDADMPMIGFWACIGLVAFLVHDLINFALFVPGVATTFFALLGICLVLRREPTSASLPPRNGSTVRFWMTMFVTGSFTIALYFSFVRPVERTWTLLQRARETVPAESNSVRLTYVQAWTIDSLDPTPVAEWLRRVAQSGTIPAPAAFHEIENQSEMLIRRNPQNIGAYRLAASLEWLVGEQYHSESHLHEAAERYETVLSLYATSPDDHLRMAEIQYALFQMTHTPASLDRAISELQQTLALNDRRDVHEIRRYPPQKVSQLDAQLKEWTLMKSKL